MIRFAILTASDQGALGAREDVSGPAIAGLVAGFGGTVVATTILPDERQLIADRLRAWSDDDIADVILTTGGTGFAARDVTPEATLDAVERNAPGLAEAMRAATLVNTPYAMIGRGVAGIRRRTLIVNLPGSPKAVRECFEVIKPVLAHAVALLRDETGDHG